MRRQGDAPSSAFPRAARPLVPLAAGALLALLAGCTAPPAVAPNTRGISASAVTDLSPAQALAPDRRGATVRWAGGIQRVDPRAEGGQCFTLLYAALDAQGVAQWTREPAYFRACSRGRYDAQLLQPFTRVVIEGRVGEPGTFLGTPVPTLEIDVLHRHSDCLASETDFVAHPECRSGVLAPQ